MNNLLGLRFKLAACIHGLAVLLTWSQARGEEPPPDEDCCPSYATLHAKHTVGSMIYGAFHGPNIGNDLCLRWVDNADGYYEFHHMVIETQASDWDFCADIPSLEQFGVWAGTLIPNLEWYWSGAPGEAILWGSGEYAEYLSYKIRVPLAEVQSYNLTVVVQDLGALCAPSESVDYGSNSDTIRVDIWAPTYEVNVDYQVGIPAPIFNFSGYFAGGLKARAASIQRIEIPTSSYHQKECRWAGWTNWIALKHGTPLLFIGPVIEYSELVVAGVLCTSSDSLFQWGVVGTLGSIDCGFAEDAGEVCVQYARDSQDAISVSMEIEAGGLCTGMDSLPAPTNGYLMVYIRARVDCEARTLIYEYNLSGSHDRFPSHVVLLDYTPVYTFDPCVTGESPVLLSGSMDRPFATDSGSWEIFRTVPF